MGRVESMNEALLDYSARRMTALVGALPDGEYTFVDQLDDDGLESAPVPIPVTLRIEEGSLEVDFTAAPSQVGGPLNSVRAIAVSAVFYVLRCLAGASVPANAGLMRVVRVRTRAGSVVDAAPPAAVSAGNVETSQRLVDTLLGAFALASPGRIPSASCGSMNNVLFGGTIPRPFVHYETLGGGAGGGPEGPGADAVHTHMTNTLNTPVEALEQEFPVRIERYAIREPTPAGPGEHPGGRGVERTYRFLVPVEVSLVTERRTIRPYGLNGAAPGAVGRNTLLRLDASEVPLPSKVTLRLRAGEGLRVETPGGGAWRSRRPSS